ncbi:GntR family transcriptional regulator [Jeotgalibacillus proteolyticus]|uniref:GntR family transcriptional regulator n=1 Tax=Jeotgalibacillus proteolyticus TaxID=2082395 RepID=A0A2S5GCI4_9BACL|nr:GntR family transcriptional regulator [Jeotgalibacillus proteolyticus]PPA70658.1 GntR family transcriptional regulator [Jeotgalibacillus proteolyticus]
MILDTDGTKPIYMQIAEWLETEILQGKFNADEKIYSQYQLADLFNINPATAGKGLAMLLEEQILYKKRGLGMFVTEDAKVQIRHRRINQTLKKLVQEVVIEAQHLEVGEEELVSMIQESIRKGEQK